MQAATNAGTMRAMNARRVLPLTSARTLYRVVAPLRPGTPVGGARFEGLGWDDRARAWRLVFGADGARLELLFERRNPRARYAEVTRWFGLHYRRADEAARLGRLAQAVARQVRQNEARWGDGGAALAAEVADGAFVVFGDLAEARLTLACNEDCPMCNSAGGADNVVADLDRFLGRLDWLRGQGVQVLTLTGGEPTLVPRLPEVIAAARAAGIARVVVQTNALRFAEPGFVDAFAGPSRPDFLLVSFHSHRPEAYEAIVGRAGTFERAVSGVRALVRAGQAVELNHVLQRANAADVEAFVQAVAGPLFGGPVGLSFSVVVPTGGQAGRAAEIPRLSELAPRLDRAVRAALGHGLTVHLSEMCGLPRCLRAGDLDRLIPAQADLADDRVKEKLPGCARCVHGAVCSGVWRDYVAEHGPHEFVPVEDGR